MKEVIGVQLQSTSLFELLKVKEIVKMYASFYKQPVPVGPLIEDMTLTEKNERPRQEPLRRAEAASGYRLGVSQ